MKILLDECLPVLFRNDLAPHDIQTVAFKGWKGISNGDLVALAAADGFEALLTVDQKVEAELSSVQLPMTIIILHAHSNSLKRLRPLVGQLKNALAALPKNSFVHIR